MLKTIIFIALLINFGNSYSQAYPKQKYSILFSFSSGDSSKAVYMRKQSEGNSHITLYNDSIFDFHSYSIADGLFRFSTGKWKIVDDTILVLVSDREISKDIFNRQHRQYSIDRYKHIDLTLQKFVLLARKYMKFFP
jgi:hypothetical protein